MNHWHTKIFHRLSCKLKFAAQRITNGLLASSLLDISRQDPPVVEPVPKSNRYKYVFFRQNRNPMAIQKSRQSKNQYKCLKLQSLVIVITPIRLNTLVTNAWIRPAQKPALRLPLGTAGLLVPALSFIHPRCPRATFRCHHHPRSIHYRLKAAAEDLYRP
jgi:hypothetical protein